MADLRLATRRSPLALAQARIVADALAVAGVGSSIVHVVTTGDTDRKTPVTTLTEVGAFVRSVQQAVLEGRADAAVHSAKDLPVTGPAELVAFYPDRAAPGDVLCGTDLQSLSRGARVGTGSPRRSSQLRLLRPDIEVVDIRGNVESRLAMIGDAVDAVVLAEAGIARLGRQSDIAYRFRTSEMVPAPAQGAIAVEAPAGSSAAQLLAAIEDGPARVAVEAERQLLSLTGAGCRSALGAYARFDGGKRLEMWGFVEDERGARRGRVSATASEAASRLREELAL